MTEAVDSFDGSTEQTIVDLFCPYSDPLVDLDNQCVAPW